MSELGVIKFIVFMSELGSMNPYTSLNIIDNRVKIVVLTYNEVSASVDITHTQAFRQKLLRQHHKSCVVICLFPVDLPCEIDNIFSLRYIWKIY